MHRRVTIAKGWPYPKVFSAEAEKPRSKLGVHTGSGSWLSFLGLPCSALSAFFLPNAPTVLLSPNLLLLYGVFM